MPVVMQSRFIVKKLTLEPERVAYSGLIRRVADRYLCLSPRFILS